MPPHAYHLRLRLAFAVELLSNGLSVATVANQRGFADQSHLSRKFKAVYGLTPAAWGAAAVGVRRGKSDGDGPCPRASWSVFRLALTTSDKVFRRFADDGQAPETFKTMKLGRSGQPGE